MLTHQAIPKRVQTLDERLAEMIESAIDLIDTLPPLHVQRLLEHLLEARAILNEPKGGAAGTRLSQ